jgi:uncharacterized protein YbjT (DUF2867 family)
MKKIIVVAGATGNLGGKIVNSLLSKDAEVRAIVRLETDQFKVEELKQKGVKVFQIDLKNKVQLAKYCEGAHCVVSALAGLRETVIDTQKLFLDAAVEAKVQRFIPSDYSSDFTNLREGQNRNLDLRREFHSYLDKSPINATTIFNGAFMDLLTTEMPLILFKQKRILCWGNPDQIMEFTTTYNVAEFTAEAALDNNTPRYLRVAGDRASCNDLVKLLSELTTEHYKLFRPGGINLLNFIIRVARLLSPSPNQLYPAWQGMQYMRDMMEGRIIFHKYENERYPQIKWTSIKEFLSKEGIHKK